MKNVYEINVKQKKDEMINVCNLCFKKKDWSKNTNDYTRYNLILHYSVLVKAFSITDIIFITLKINLKIYTLYYSYEEYPAYTIPPSTMLRNSNIS